MPHTQAQYDAAREAGDANEYAMMHVDDLGLEQAIDSLAAAADIERDLAIHFPARKGFLADAYKIVELMGVSDEGAE